MAERAAVNTSPLIFLSKAGLLELLRLFGPTIVVPRAVANEVARFGPDDPTFAAVHRTSWLQVLDTPAIPPVIQAWDLGAGESAVLAWGYAHQNTEVIIDDLAARNCAAALGIPVRGTLGLVLTAKMRGTIPAARPIIEKMRASGMYLSDRVVDSSLRHVGE